MNLGKASLSIIKDPFKTEKLSSVAIFGTPPSYFHKEGKWRAVIEFKNEDTEGKQNIEVNDFTKFGELIEKVQIFINSL